MLDYLLKSLIEIKGQYPNCGILLSGDFNQTVIKTRDTRPSGKQERGRFLNSINCRSIIESKPSRAENHLSANFINTGLNILMQIKEKKVHINDPPWITAELK